MKKLIALILAVAMILPMNVHAQQNRNWWPEQIDESDEYHNVDVVGKWPGDVITNEIAIDTITFRPVVISAKLYPKSTKIKVDATTAVRVIVVQYTLDGQHWIQQSFRNASYKGPVRCIRKWQGKLYAKEDRYFSWCIRQFKQGKVTLDYKKNAHTKGQGAQLFFDDYLIDKIRLKVKSTKTLTILERAKIVRIRYVYSGLKKDVFSPWITVAVR